MPLASSHHDCSGAVATVLDSWPAAIDAHGAHLADLGRTTRTRAVYAGVLRSLAAYTEPLSPGDLSADELLAWLAHEHISDRTWTNRRAVLRSFYSWALGTERSPAELLAASRRRWPSSTPREQHPERTDAPRATAALGPAARELRSIPERSRPLPRDVPASPRSPVTVRARTRRAAPCRSDDIAACELARLARTTARIPTQLAQLSAILLPLGNASRHRHRKSRRDNAGDP